MNKDLQNSEGFVAKHLPYNDKLSNDNNDAGMAKLVDARDLKFPADTEDAELSCKTPVKQPRQTGQKPADLQNISASETEESPSPSQSSGELREGLTEIHPGMDFDEWRQAWFRICRERGHVLKTWDEDSTEVDNFVTGGGYCNGPGCVNCGWTACMHCDWRGDKIPTCTAIPTPPALSAKGE